MRGGWGCGAETWQTGFLEARGQRRMSRASPSKHPGEDRPGRFAISSGRLAATLRFQPPSLSAAAIATVMLSVAVCFANSSEVGVVCTRKSYVKRIVTNVASGGTSPT